MSFRCQAQVNNSKSEGSVVTNAQTDQDPSVSEKRKDKEEKKKKKEKKAKGNSEEDKDESTMNGVGVVDSAVITNSEVSCHSSVSGFNVIKVLYSP